MLSEQFRLAGSFPIAILPFLGEDSPYRSKALSLCAVLGFLPLQYSSEPVCAKTLVTPTAKIQRVFIRDFSVGVTITIMLLVTFVAIGGLVQLSEAHRTNNELRFALASLEGGDTPGRVRGMVSGPWGGWFVILGTILITLLGISTTMGAARRARSDLQRQQQARSEMEEIVHSRTAELQRTREHLARAEAAKADFLAVMSHELRTPLNTILGYTQLLLKTPTHAHTRNEYLEAILSGGDALRGMVSEVLDFAAIERGSIRVDLEPVDIRQLVRAILVAMQPPNHSERMVADLDESLPERIWADENKLRQVIINLVANALKFTPHGSVTIRCRVEEAQRLTVDVIDDGIGISEAEIPRLFEPFTQGESTMRRRYGGAGLGLAICKRFVEAMGGSIRARSRQGNGSHFTFWLPLRAVPAEDVSFSEIPPLPEACRSIRCLVVDDNRVNRKLVVALLARLGLEAEAAGSGEECLSLFQETIFDMIFMDLEMPEMDGFDTTLEIRRVERCRGASPVTVFALTGDVFDGVQERCAAAGMDGYLTKPIQPRELITAISSIRHAAAASLQRLAS